MSFNMESFGKRNTERLDARGQNMAFSFLLFNSSVSLKKQCKDPF